MPRPLFRQPLDPDEKRKEVLWTAISFAAIFAVWLAVVLVFGYQPLILGMTYDEAVLVTGLALLVVCSFLYLLGKEREQRYTNRRLLAELKVTVARLDERVRQLHSLCEVSAELAGSLDLDCISQLVVESLRESARAERSWLVLADERAGHVVYWRSSPSPQDLDQAHGTGSPWSALLPSGADRLTQPETQVEAWNRDPRLMAAPLRLESGLVGVLAAARAEAAPEFGEGDMGLLTTLANMTANAMKSAHLHAELRESYLATVQSLVRSLDARDNYAASHGQRVTALAVRIAEQLGLPDSLVRDLEVFAPLHDVGKIGIPDAILLKTSPLTPEEKDACREHCEIGERILRPLKPSQQALGLVRSHHECWDGRGYPDGLAGDRIPLLARILRVADCYDALSADRPYGRVMSEEEALAHFRLQAGKDYDPVVVAALEAVLKGDQPAGSEQVEMAAGAQAEAAQAAV